jgi:Family of unknown function (DUF6519)
MGSDRARVSYDPRQDYRAVLMQQGRVTVEADWNEQQRISGDELLLETLDFVGPAGTPDDGYRINETGQPAVPPFDFSVGAGTMYVGGVRVSAPAPIVYSQQSEWLDHAGDPDWVDLPDQRQPPGDELIYLYLREQEVSAVEDSALREIALGGPDTAARLRLIQHIVRLPTSSANCDAALEDARKKWTSEGLVFDPATMRLTPQSTLQLSFPPLPPPDPCEPTAPGGFLGADNQLIRIQLSGPNKFVWGYDNASFLYRVDVIDPQTVHLQSRPVDALHQPRANQAVEVLRSAAKLANGELVASASGFVETLTAPYNPDTQNISLPVALPAEYGDGNPAHPAPPRVFLRVWEQEISFTPGTAVALGDTGLKVTLQSAGGAPFHVGDYWMVAVRPSTPTKVYPQRYLDGPQPPDGPRMWACPLGVINWTGGALKVVDDCRKHICTLADACGGKGGGCCTVNVGPEDVSGDNSLQSTIDALANRGQVTLCLAPGVYALPQPLRLGAAHSNLTIEACHDGAVIRAAEGAERKFLQGLIILDRADNVTFRGLRFELPQVPFAEAGGKLAAFDQPTTDVSGSLIEDLFVSIGLRPVHCAVLTVKDCLFRFTVTRNKDCFGVGIFAASECWGLNLIGNRFVRDEDYLRVRQRPLRMLIGYLLAPAASVKQARRTTTAVEARIPAGSLVRSLLQDARFEGNLFSGLTVGALIYASIGVIGLRGNTVRECHAGFWLLSLRTVAYAALLNRVAVKTESSAFAVNLHNSILGAMLDPLVQVGSVIARSYPLPAEIDLSHALQVEARRVPATPPKEQMLIQNVFDRLTPLFSRAHAGAGAQPAPAAGQKAGTTNVSEAAGAAVERSLALAPELAQFSQLNLSLSAFERQALTTLPEHGFGLSLDVADNDINLLVTRATSSIGLLAWDDERDTRSMATVTGNKLRSESPSIPAALLLMVERCAVTGNLIFNEQAATANQRHAPSLVMFPGSETPSIGGEPVAPVSVTGNVFRGRALLPPRPPLTPPAPPPMDSWDFFNNEL